MTALRLDKALVARGLARSRAEAQALIAAGQVTAGGRAAARAGQTVEAEEDIAVHGERLRYVSRGGLKLEAALDRFGLEVTGRTALDVGASTGGFTDCLLQHGIAHVVALDVGHGQMVPALAHDPRVEVREGVNARYLTPRDFGSLFDIIVVDVSFISLSLILPALAPLVCPDGTIVCLVKPQFEVGREQLGKGGVVRSPADRLAALEQVKQAARATGLSPLGEIASPIAGADGNQEFLLWLAPPAGGTPAGGE